LRASSTDLPLNYLGGIAAAFVRAGVVVAGIRRGPVREPHGRRAVWGSAVL